MFDVAGGQQSGVGEDDVDPAVVSVPCLRPDPRNPSPHSPAGGGVRAVYPGGMPDYQEDLKDALRTGMAIALDALTVDMGTQEDDGTLSEALQLIDISASFQTDDVNQLERDLDDYAHRLRSIHVGLMTSMAAVVRALAQRWRDADPQADPEGLVRELIALQAKIDADPDA